MQAACALIFYAGSSGLGVCGPSGRGSQQCPLSLGAPTLGLPASAHLSNNQSHMWSCRKTDAVFPFVKSSCWTTVSFMGSVRKDGILKWQCCLCTAPLLVWARQHREAGGPSHASKSSNETGLRPSTASHLFWAAVYTCHYTSIDKLVTDNNLLGFNRGPYLKSWILLLW